MGLNETIVFYGVIGVAVAVAVYLRDGADDSGQRTFRVVTAVLFWPLYLPVLLSQPQTQPNSPATAPAETRDEMARAIAQVDAELDAALSSLDGWAEDVLAREKDRIQELRSAWNGQAGRIREMDRLLAQPESARVTEATPATDHSPLTTHNSPNSYHHSPDSDRRRLSELARQKNIERLRQTRTQAYDDLMGTLAWVRELVSMIHLAKFTGAPASRAEELVAQIAAAVEGVSAVTWQEEVERLNC
ncbi:MAG: hypothetical protein HY000_09115 [Planctomycetes bacterium]|nr:hypothetical protein [Planctomycetota bacterium]